MRDLIVETAKDFDLDPAIVWGICQQESGFNPAAVRYEPHYRWLVDPERVKPRLCSVDTEIVFQKVSIGLMQVMGAVYREHGYRGWLSEILLSQSSQLFYGCKHLAGLIDRYGKVPGIAAYNAGSPRRNSDGRFVNQYYVDRVLDYAEEFRSGKNESA
jgi:soluble lytic murein transglycosylase-like protein